MFANAGPGGAVLGFIDFVLNPDEGQLVIEESEFTPLKRLWKIEKETRFQ